MKWSTLLTVVVAFAVCSVMSATPVFAKAGDLLFQYKLGELGGSSPAIGSDGTIYACGTTYDWNVIGSRTSDDGFEYPVMEFQNGDYGLMAFLSNGTLKWKLPLPGSAYNPAIDSNGTIYISALVSTIADNRDTNKYSTVYAVNPDGTVKWTFSTDAGIWGAVTLAIGNDNTIYFTVAEVNIHSPSVEFYNLNTTLYALNSDGTVKWTYNSGQNSHINSSPVIAEDGTIYFPASNILYAMNSDGTLKWTFKGDPDYIGDSIYENYIGITPSIGADGTIYFGNRCYNFYALNPDGTLKWKHDTQNYIYGGGFGFLNSSPVIMPDGTINCFSSNELLTFNPGGSSYNRNRSLVWEFLEAWTPGLGHLQTASSDIAVTPVIDTEGTLYIGDVRNYGPSYTGDAIINADGFSGTSYISAINPDGSIKWQYATETGVVGSPIISSDGVLLVTDYRGMLYAIDTGTNAGPIDAPWPMLGKNQFRTSNAGDTRVAKIGIRNTNGTAVETAAAPVDFAIKGNYPNPFNPTTTIEFSLNKAEKTSLTIYNVAGQRVRELILNANMAPGVHSILWNGKDDSGKAVSSGVYFARLNAGAASAVKSMMMVK